MTLSEIFDLWPSDRKICEDVGLSAPGVSKCRKHGRIHCRHWAALIAAAERRGIKGVTWESLGEAHAQHFQKSSTEAV